MCAMLQAHTTSGDFSHLFYTAVIANCNACPFLTIELHTFQLTYPPPLFFTLHINALFNKTNEVQVFVNFILFLFKHV